MFSFSDNKFGEMLEETALFDFTITSALGKAKEMINS